MFDIGFSELLVVAVVGLVVLGPKRLPEVARTAGQWVAKIRRFISDVKQDIDREMQQADLTELRNLKRELDETRRVVEDTSGRLIRDANIAVSPHAASDAGAAPAAISEPAVAAAQPPPDPPPVRTRKKRATKSNNKNNKKKSAVSKSAHGRTR